jgi:hypothetical protein
MKRLALLCALLLAAGDPLRAASADPYEELAARLSSAAAKKLTDKKIAVLTFDYVDGRSSPGGRTVAEKLTNRFVELGELTVIERSMVEKVMGELEFQNRGTVDPDAAKKLGKGLGVEAIVTGTLEPSGSGQIEINARIIKTESYEIVAAGSQKVKKTWQDAAPDTGPATPEVTSTPVSRPAPAFGNGKGRGYLDFLFGPSAGTVDVDLSASQTVTATQLGVPVSIPVGTRSASFTGLTMSPATVLGLRVGGFKGILGGDMELGSFTHGTEKQTVSSTIGGFRLNVPLPQDYLTIQTNYFVGDLHLCLPMGNDGRLVPYFGLGLGLSMNNVTSDYVRMYPGNVLLNDSALGFMFRVPFGIRFFPTDHFSLFMEGRPWFNNFAIDRDYSGETDTINQRGFQFLLGLGLGF